MINTITEYIIIFIVLLALVGFTFLFIGKVKLDFDLYAKSGNICHVSVNDKFFTARIVSFTSDRKFAKTFIEDNKFISTYPIEYLHPFWKYNYRKQRERKLFVFLDKLIIQR